MMLFMYEEVKYRSKTD